MGNLVGANIPSLSKTLVTDITGIRLLSCVSPFMSLDKQVSLAKFDNFRSGVIANLPSDFLIERIVGHSRARCRAICITRVSKPTSFKVDETALWGLHTNGLSPV